MGKKGNKSKKDSAKSAPKCTCDHPYNCTCGNRPPRPSKGHKWDSETQQWGGKGHKQKGASGQTASVAQPEKTVGSTTMTQWQKLPSQLLEQVCQKEGRPRPKYKSIGAARYRVIVQDAKVARRGTDHDLIFVPASNAETDEIAKQEAALVALLHMTPNIPHERKLPEPYKTTWLQAVQAAKEKTNNTTLTTKEKKTSGTIEKKNAAASAADEKKSGIKQPPATSKPLTMAGFASGAERRKHREEVQRQRKARIRRHEAIRMANQNHQVFMSAQCRKRIENLLRGDTSNALLEVSDEEDDDLVEEENDAKAYVVRRLHHEGFTLAQARTAYSNLTRQATEDESQWDDVYEECLQWLCIHLDEDQLPEGFDPRGRTLDVIVAPTTTKKNDGGSTESKDDAQMLARRYGISNREASIMMKQSSSDAFVEQVMWTTICQAAETVLEDDSGTNDPSVVAEEIEALQAIFPPEECNIQKKDAATTIAITIPSDGGQPFTLEIVIDEKYPWSFPRRVLLSDGWPQNSSSGGACHVAMVKFIATLKTGEPMIYEIFGQATELVHSAQDGEMKQVSLLPALGERVAQSSSSDNTNKRQHDGPKEDSAQSSVPMKKRIRRPRERSFFWSKPPKDTPAATAFPEISYSMRSARKDLPAAKARDEFLAVLKQAQKGGRVILCTGETGCGKSTQLPQFILEEFPKDSKIVVAQPRRLAATGVADRVANERGEGKAGTGSVGYVVRGDSAVCNNTRLLFCTTGVLLRQLQSDNALDSLTHIVVDEVHERHLDTDVLLGVLKASLRSTPHLTLVLMSATLDADRFAAYWGSNTPRIHIPGRTFPVTDFMLEDVLNVTGYIPPKKGKKRNNFNRGYQRPKKSSPWEDSEKSDDDEAGGDDANPVDEAETPSSFSHDIPIEDLVERVDESRVDYDMVGQLVKYLVKKKEQGSDGSILIFLSGAPEINAAKDTISRIVRGMSIELLPLHGGLQPKDQNLVFRPAQQGYTKVILSTNVAETSITIPDCTIVIDSCREKQSSYDPSNRMPLLVEHFAAKANLRQRRGRAGRVRKGTCYKLISKKTYENLQDHGDPEIRRCALDQTLLSLMFLGVERGSGNFLRTLLDPPSKASVGAAILSLQKLGAVTTGEDNLYLTPLGMHLAGIPAPPTVGKILVMASILGCRTAGLAMAAGMSVGRSPFLRVDTNRRRNDDEESIEDMKKRLTLEERESLFKSVGNSDHAMLAAAYLNWDGIRTGASDRRRYCEKLGLSFNGMREMKQLVNQLDSSLASSGYVASTEADRNGKSWRIIRTCAVAALAPSQLVRVQRPVTKYAETAEGAVEKDGVARELKFYIRVESSSDSQQQGTDERVFMHPSSSSFAVGSYSCPWLVYHSLVRTSKAFLRDATECSAYSLLLFGGKLEVQASKGVIVIDNWVQLAANARIGALIGGLRRKVDELLTKKVEDPSFDIASTVEMKLIVSLLVSDGLGH